MGLPLPFPTYKTTSTMLVLTVAVQVIAVLGEVAFDLTKFAGVLLGTYIPCKPMAQGVALDDTVGAIGGVRGVHGHDLAGMDRVSMEGV